MKAARGLVRHQNEVLIIGSTSSYFCIWLVFYAVVKNISLIRLQPHYGGNKPRKASWCTLFEPVYIAINHSHVVKYLPSSEHGFEDTKVALSNVRIHDALATKANISEEGPNVLESEQTRKYPACPWHSPMDVLSRTFYWSLIVNVRIIKTIHWDSSYLKSSGANGQS